LGGYFLIHLKHHHHFEIAKTGSGQGLKKLRGKGAFVQGAYQSHPLFLGALGMINGKEMHLFPPFYTKNDRFTKTGSGQT
jgi:hypothetical protein